MIDEQAAPPEADDNDEEARPATGLPIAVRLLGTVAIAALIVALYAVVQLTSGEDEPIAAVDIGLGEEIRPLAGGTPPEAGTPAPDFTVLTLDGEPFSLGNHLATDGRPVFLNMWAEWCFPCRQEMPAIDAAARANPDVHFIGVVIRDREAPARAFVEEYGITYQIGLDNDGAVEDGYFVWVMPSTYLIGSDGRIVDRFFGPMDEDDLDELVAGLLPTS